MKNTIRSPDGKIWERKSKNLTKGEIQCPKCGDWKSIAKFTDKHFDEVYMCITCKKDFVEPTVKLKKQRTLKKEKLSFPDDCYHKPFFGCKNPKSCIGCYYNPNKKIAMIVDEDDLPKPKYLWFYHDKKHAKKCLDLLDDIKNGRGLHSGGNRASFKHARINKNEEDENEE